MSVTTIFEWVDEDCTSSSSKIDVLYFEAPHNVNITAKSLIQNPDNQKPGTNTVYLTDSYGFKSLMNNTFIKNQDGSLNSSMLIPNLVNDNEPIFNCKYSNVTTNPDNSVTVFISGTYNDHVKNAILEPLPFTQVTIVNNSSTQTTYNFYDGTTEMGTIIFDYYSTETNKFNSIHCTSTDIMYNSVQLLIYTNMAIAYYQNALDLGILPNISVETFNAMYGLSVEPVYYLDPI